MNTCSIVHSLKNAPQLESLRTRQRFALSDVAPTAGQELICLLIQRARRLAPPDLQDLGASFIRQFHYFQFLLTRGQLEPDTLPKPGIEQCLGEG